VLRLRNAIERASQNRWLGFLVVACLAVLLLFVVFHGIDHALEATAAFGCVAIVLGGAIVLLAREVRATARTPLPNRRAPPTSAARTAPAANFLAIQSLPLRR
jgi:hypothetical protein